VGFRGRAFVRLCAALQKRVVGGTNYIPNEERKEENLQRGNRRVFNFPSGSLLCTRY